MQALYKEYKSNDKVAFFFIYVNEAHPSRTPVRNDKDKGFRGIGRAKKIEDRVIAASKCMVGLKLTMPVLLDRMSGVAEKAYSGRPAATVVVDFEGKVRMHTTGPWGSQPKKAREVLAKVLADHARSSGADGIAPKAPGKVAPPSPPAVPKKAAEKNEKK